MHLIVYDIGSYNWRKAIKGMRNAKESWHKMDSTFTYDTVNDRDHPQLGNNDYQLALGLVKAGTEHRKFLRQIFVSADVEAPWYWWKEYETYQIGTTENSTSQMHKMGSRLLTHEDFVVDIWDQSMENLLTEINETIKFYQDQAGENPLKREY